MNDDLYSKRLDEALLLAADAFRKKTRKATKVPYLTHLLQVMATVGKNNGDEDQMIAAVLHDYLEDIPGASKESLADRFGARVAMMVETLSDATGQPKPPWKERKLASISRIKNEAPAIKLICAADKLDNIRSIRSDLIEVGESIWDRFKPTKEQSLWYYREILSALSTNWRHPLLEELRAEIALVHQMAGIPWPKTETEPV